ncbi:hypothetical protein LAHI110946_08205 [Lactococcus hircilactis]
MTNEKMNALNFVELTDEELQNIVEIKSIFFTNWGCCEKT